MTFLSAARPCQTGTPSLTVTSYGDPEARRLARALHAEQVAVYGFADDPDDTPASHFELPQGLFIVARCDESPEAVGCGGWRLLSPGTAEIKRMYVTQEGRGGGIGRQILEHLESHAVSRGVIRMVLETGVRNDAALALYRRCGYQPCPSYVPGRDSSVNRAMVKRLPWTGC
ncbi:GNAT family N-acetyltransferase [Streptomyces sp. RPA4-5]|uniref:GNAT family N-acetyltransferase n=1 Tax=Streptomyces sp. RPA4-5 TaxID=2721245 RepID=UPI00143EA498|nr:GNAT family N-acetyltransferase [Streptomyces sp. RPA4-5]QIY59042.1 GNAT family N-acetyltransferase [Streptomyces sp. RPA4-5]